MSAKFCNISGLSLISRKICVILRHLTICHVWVAFQTFCCCIDTWLSDIPFLFFSTIAIFAKNYDDVLTVWIYTEKIQMHFWKQNFDVLLIPLCKKINIIFSDNKDLQCKCNKNALWCIISSFPPHSPLNPVFASFFIFFTKMIS